VSIKARPSTEHLPISDSANFLIGRLKVNVKDLDLLDVLFRKVATLRCDVAIAISDNLRSGG